MTWWLQDANRALTEKLRIADLLETEPWLSEVKWRLGEDLHLCVDFDISLRDETFVLTMIYPATFADTPPIVKTRDGRRISQHQWGYSEELCLEYRPDNWDPSYTGAMMISSAHRLIAGERQDVEIREELPSAHDMSQGQDLRGSHFRFLWHATVSTVLSELPISQPVPAKFWERVTKNFFIAALDTIDGKDLDLWEMEFPIPSTSRTYDGFAYRTEYEVSQYRRDPTQFLRDLPDKFPDLVMPLKGIQSGVFLVIGDKKDWTILFQYPSNGEMAMVQYVGIEIPENRRRLPLEHGVLADTRVGIIGCGSIGSKIATTLARSGIRKFTFIDHDIFFPGNLVRNDLDANALGMHKVDALAIRIKDIVKDGDISCRRVAFGQQESSTTTESVMAALAECDLIIEATADDRAFNLAAAVARKNRKPIVWCEVFGGGIGGILARARPDLDPTPISARNQIQAWCEARNAPWNVTEEKDYRIRPEDAPPLIADDGDVSVIAGHASRMALDIMIRSESRFPYSAYAVGLSSGWIFSAPFDTWPIEFHADGGWSASDKQVDLKEALKVLSEFFSADRDE